MKRSGSSKISESTSILVQIDNKVVENEVTCAILPDDILNSVFSLLAHTEDIGTIPPLKLVCKRWHNCLLHSVSEAIIKDYSSIDALPLFPSLRFLTIESGGLLPLDIFEACFTQLETLSLWDNVVEWDHSIPNEMWSQMTKLKSLHISNEEEYGPEFDLDEDHAINNINLKLLTNLQILKIHRFVSNLYSSTLQHLIHLKEIEIIGYMKKKVFQKTFGFNFSVLEHLKELKKVTLFASKNSWFDKNEVQEKYPNIQFRYLIYQRKVGIKGYYEGGFSKSAPFVREGKGVSVLYDSGRYEGDYKNDMMNGKGIWRFLDGSYYQGDFKESMIHGKGIYHYPNGDRFEAEFIMNVGKGVKILVDGSRSESSLQFKKNDAHTLEREV